MSDNSTHDDEPELRRLLDKIHGEHDSMFEEKPKKVEEPESERIHEKPPALESKPYEPDPAALEEARLQEAEAVSLYAAPPDSLKQDLRNFPVTVDCTLASLQKTLGEVSQILVGEIIKFGGTVDSPMQLKVNGRVFAQGRLVLVDDQLAIEVTEKFE